jgi:hypothetical protein
MSDFNSLQDWQKIDQQISRTIWSLHNLSNKRQIERMYRNLNNSVMDLSRADVERRRFGHSVKYNEQLLKVQQELQELQGWLIFATLLDEKPKE